MALAEYAQTHSVWKLKLSGTTEDLRRKLGQECYREFSNDIQLADEVLDFLQDRFARCQTKECEELLNKISDDLDAFTQRITPVQRQLHSIGLQQNFDLNGTCSPSWAKGAHIFVTKDVADELQEALESEEDLSAYHVIVSDEYKGFIDMALAQHATVRNRGSKQPRIKEQVACSLVPLSPSFARFCQSFYYESRQLPVRPASLRTRLTHSTGSMPSGEAQDARAWGQTAHKKKFKLTELAKPSSQGEEDAAVDKHIAVLEDDVRENGDRTSNSLVFFSAPPSLETFPALDVDRVKALITDLLDALDKEKPNLMTNLPKTSSQFANVVKEHLITVHGELLERLFDHMGIEAELASALQSDAEDASARLKQALDTFATCVTQSLGEAPLLSILKLLLKGTRSSSQNRSQVGLLRAFEESCVISAKNLAQAVLAKVDKAKRPVLKELKKITQHGIHATSKKVKGLLFDLCKDALESDARLIAQKAWTEQEQLYHEKMKVHDAGTGTREERQSRVRVKQVNTSLAPAWMAAEARRHKEYAGDGPGHYERAVE
eukprot:TRINITY_DN104001_c0_g1_i1.p1 TRINITY_DN104001_c0_g1~~TRINITY_DN104001_c0_g1_i1.p1  ORF type:complete len:549 (+),score=117.82 TRINITY_DN104001_c0_g1_i1:72-1718(+)